MVAGCSLAGCGDTEVPESASSIAELYMLCVASTTAKVMTFITTPAMDRPLPDFLPFTHAIVPMSARTKPIAASKAEKLLMMGRNDVARAIIPRTKPAIPSPDFDSCGAGATCTVLVSMSIPFP